MYGRDNQSPTSTPTPLRGSFDVARQDPPPGVSSEAAAGAIAEVLDWSGETCRECPSNFDRTNLDAANVTWWKPLDAGAVDRRGVPTPIRALSR